MSTLQSIAIALDALRQNFFRSVLTVLGIIIGVASVITILAFGNGAEQQVAERIRTMGSNLLMVRPGISENGGVRGQVGSGNTLTEDDAIAIAREIPGVMVSAPGVAGAGQLVRGNLNWNTLVGGVTADYLVARDWHVAEGRPLLPEDQQHAAKVVLLGTTVVKQLFGADDPIGQTVRIGTVPFTVIGVLVSKGGGGAMGRDQDDVALIPMSTAKLRLLGARSQIHRGSVDYVMVKVGSAAAIPEAREGIRALLRQTHRLQAGGPDDFHVEEPSSAMEVQAATKRSLTLLLGAVASVSIIVGGISIMNIMLVSVTERTREIGLRQALGARRAEVRNQFLIEAVVLCLLGGIAGVALGSAVAVAVARVAGWPIDLTLASVLFSLGFALLAGILSGLYPAYRAAKLDPIEALRSE
ncbi:MAG: FtsX-like permease family protein [Alphaproteobacteria bacterium]|nr:FtsX-like permease family protein [Alphaproteobacteria bacterium]